MLQQILLLPIWQTEQTLDTIRASLHHLGVESSNSVLNESNNLGFLQVYSLTQLIQALWQDLDVSNKQKKVDSDFLQIQWVKNVSKWINLHFKCKIQSKSSKLTQWKDCVKNHIFQA